MMGLDDLFGLHGSVSVVTGAGRGLGREAAIALASAGSDIVVVGRSADELARVSAEIEAMGHSALAVRADVAQADSAQMIVESTMSHFGRLDVLVNNAGMIVRQAIEEIDDAAVERQMSVNLLGPIALCKAAVPLMKRAGSGKIINVTSVGGSRGCYQFGIYSATKAGLSMFTKSLAVELARDGHDIQVNCIAPGSLLTPMNEAAGRENPEHFDRLMSIIPMKRNGRSEEIQGLVIFLASRASSYITGQEIFIDGGATAAWV